MSRHTATYYVTRQKFCPQLLSKNALLKVVTFLKCVISVLRVLPILYTEEETWRPTTYLKNFQI